MIQAATARHLSSFTVSIISLVSHHASYKVPDRYTDNYGDGCSSNGVFLGTYTISDTHLTIHFAYPAEADRSLPNIVLATSTLHDINTWEIESSFFHDNYTRVSPRVFDGVWQSSGQDKLFVELEADTYVSYSNNEVYFGVMETEDPVGVDTNASIHYTLVHNNNNIPSNTIVATDFDGSASQLNFSNPSFTTVFDSKVPTSVLEGVWTCDVQVPDGIPPPCSATVEFVSNMFRVYTFGCEDESTVATGTFEHNSTHMELSYHFSPIQVNLQGTIQQLSYVITGSDMIVSNPEFTFPFECKRVETAPSATVVTYTLAADFNTFNATAFREDLAAVLGLKPSNVLILSATAGSTVVETVVVDDQVINVAASTACNNGSVTSIGGVSVANTAVVSCSIGFSSGAGTVVASFGMVILCAMLLFL